MMELSDHALRCYQTYHGGYEWAVDAGLIDPDAYAWEQVAALPKPGVPKGTISRAINTMRWSCLIHDLAENPGKEQYRIDAAEARLRALFERQRGAS